MTTNDDVRSRRNLLTAGIAAAGAALATTLGRATPVRAEGEIMHVGDDHFTATSRTFLKNSANNDDVFVAVTTGSGKGVWGKNDGGGIGVHGQALNAGYGVLGSTSVGIGVGGTSFSNFGVYGESDGSDGVHGASRTASGVFGTSGGGSGVEGQSNSHDGILGRSIVGRGVRGASNSGVGVQGASGSGTGVEATSDSGLALRTSGRVRLDLVSGVATIPAGATSVTVSPGVGVSPDAFVLLTPQVRLDGRDLWYTVDPTADTIRIRISSSRTGPTRISWLLLG